MKKLTVKDERNDANSKENGVNDYRCRVELELVTHGRLGAKTLELIDTTSSDRGSSSRVGARAIASADDVALLQVKAAHLALMNRPAVITTRSGGSESLNLALLSLLVMGDDAHRVASLDLLDILPTDLMSAEWIDDDDSLVVEDHRWMKEDLIEDSRREDGPSACDYTARESVIKEVNVAKSGKEEEAQKGEYVGARGTEELAIVHEEIFSRAREMRAA